MKIFTFRSRAGCGESTELKIVQDKHGLSLVINNSRGSVCACCSEPVRIAPPEQDTRTAPLFEKLLEVAETMRQIEDASAVSPPRVASIAAE